MTMHTDRLQAFFKGCRIRHNPVKRTFDILFSLCALLFLLPVLLIVSLLVWVNSPGNILYCQERIGRGGKRFTCYKFRTMHQDAENRLSEMIANCPKTRGEWESTRKLRNDPRILPMGHFLRKTSLDELPQFWNVLKGDLSVVGPRPIVESELANHLGIKASKIFSIRPGITGIWQISGRSDICYQTRIKLDEKYVDQHSIGMDIKLILQTIPQIFSGKGAY